MQVGSLHLSQEQLYLLPKLKLMVAVHAVIYQLHPIPVLHWIASQKKLKPFTSEM